MIGLCLSITPAPVQARGWVVYVLPAPGADRPHESRLFRAMQLEQEPQWMPMPRRFACKAYAIRAMRREIRSGAAVAAKLYWGGDLKGYWQRCPETGRELKMHIAPTS